MFGNHSDVDKLDYWSDFLVEQLRPVLMIISGYLVLGTVGNVFVMYIYWFGNKTSGEDRFFIPFLALFDLCANAVCSGSEIITEVNPLRFDSDIVCRLMALSSIAFVTMSSHLLLLITIDRYLKICTPFKSQMTLRRKKIALVFIVFAGTVVALPSLGLYGSVAVTMWEGNVTGRLCINVPSGETRIWHLTYKTVMFLYGSVHFLALVVLYILMLRSIYIQSRTRHRLQSCQWQRPTRGTQVREQTKIVSQSDKRAGENCVTDTPGHTSSYSIATISDGMMVPGNLPGGEMEPVTNNRSNYSLDVSCQDDGGRLMVKSDTVDTQTNQNRASDIPGLQKQDAKLVKSTKRFKIKGLRLTLVFLVISIVYAITIGLKLVLMTIESAKENFWITMTPSEFVWFRFLYCVFVVNFIVNPFVYGFLDRKFQQIVRKQCTCR
ncbi:uncharacterized protein LOC132549143 [Ylistrum balloti]|uniref:uncharacterized protein LOC132549143 n=1 Tax=Ylistrum balloti TaxID=509963 RepID=UPI002905B87F|nr:uncharacterized protein LOC132549143 [Ylistrum balloti]